MAAPQVAGALALLLGAFPGLAPAAQEAALRSGALDLGAAGADDTYGAGRVNVLTSYTGLAASPPPPPPPPPAPAFLRDGFESGNLTAWSGSTGKGLRVSSSAALSGGFGLEVTPVRGPSYVTDGHVSGQRAVRISLNLAARSLAGFGSPWADILEGDGGQQLFAVQLRVLASGVQVRLTARRVLFDIPSAPATLTAGTHRLELVWRPATEGATLSLDGRPIGSIDHLPARALARVRIGALTPLVWRTGTLAFDDYESTQP